ncbi:hypothetical protein [Hyella patelloides]|nr:hypothetical protein [Hyella patelloides]
MAETPIIWYSSVDGLYCISYSDFKGGLLPLIMNKIQFFNYPTKKRPEVQSY